MYEKSSLAKTRLKYPSLIFDEAPTQTSYDSWIFKDIESAYKISDEEADKDADEDNINHYKYEKQIISTLIKLLFHITLISIFETLFYFLYVSSLENNGIENAINTFINAAIEDCYNMTLEQIKVIDNVLETYINASDVIQKGNTEELERHKYNKHILNIAWGYVSGLAGLFVILSVYTRVRKIKINWKNVVLENLAMVILLGLYELLFFNTIVHKYLPISTQELAQGAVEKLQIACRVLT